MGAGGHIVSSNHSSFPNLFRIRRYVTCARNPSRIRRYKSLDLKPLGSIPSGQVGTITVLYTVAGMLNDIPEGQARVSGLP
jgi:hypothetical protein